MEINIFLPEFLRCVCFKAVEFEFSIRVTNFNGLVLNPFLVQLRNFFGISVAWMLLFAIGVPVLTVTTVASYLEGVIFIVAVFVWVWNTSGCWAAAAALCWVVFTFRRFMGTSFLLWIAKAWLTVTPEVAIISSVLFKVLLAFSINACHIVFAATSTWDSKIDTRSVIWLCCAFFVEATVVTDLAIHCFATCRSINQISRALSAGTSYWTRSEVGGDAVGCSIAEFLISSESSQCTTGSHARAGLCTV